MMWMTGPLGDVQFVNRAYRSFCGVGKGETDQSKWEQLIRPADAPEYTAALEHAITARTTFRAEAAIGLQNGERRVIGSTAEPCISPDGAYLGHIGLSADITARMQNEENRKSELSLMLSIHSESFEGILVVNQTGSIIFVNQPFLELWGVCDEMGARRTVEQLVGGPGLTVLKWVLDCVADPETLAKRVDDLLAHPDKRDYAELALKDGRTIERHSATLRDQSGEYIGRVWYCRDVTTSKRSEQSLIKAKTDAERVNRLLRIERLSLENERRMLHALIDNVPDFMYVKDTQSRFVVANAHLARVLGVKSPKELIGKTDFDFFPPEMVKYFYEDEQALLRSGQPLYDREETCLDEAGREIRILTSKVPIRNSEGVITGLAGVGRNITARIQMENDLREAERKYRGIFDKAIVGIFQSIPEGRFLSVNPSMASMLGYNSPEEMVSLITDIAHQFYADPRKREDFRARINTLGGVQNFECKALRKDGTEIWLSMSVRSIFQDGVVVRYEGMCEDITERRLLRDQLLQAQKLESVGQLAAGIAHEINTPTQYIGDNAQFVKESFRDLKNFWDKLQSLAEMARENDCYRDILDDISATRERVDVAFLMDEIPRAIDQALEGVNRVANLVRAMREFSHPGTKDKIPLDLNHAIESTITISRNEWKYVADLETDFDKSLRQVQCVPAEINQVILNLIVNAAHAIGDAIRASGGEKGRIAVQTRSLQDCAEIRISDTGTGIPAGICNRVFDPFFTTKEIGKGTGQGLAIAHSVVVDKHGGTIRFDTEEGKGTTFIVCLPYSGQNPTARVSIE